MSLPKSELSEILNAMGNVLTRLVDRVENDREFQPYERRAILNTMYEKMCGVQMQEILDDANKSHSLVPKRGDGAVNDAYTGLPGEITVDMDAKTVRVHDGETTGGIAMARAMDTIGDWVVESQLPTAENNYTWYRKYKSGWVEQGGAFTASTGGTRLSIIYPVPMANTNYCALFGETDDATNNQFIQLRFYDKTTDGVSIYANLVGRHTNSWYVCGLQA